MKRVALEFEQEFEAAKLEICQHSFKGAGIKTLLLSFSEPRLTLSSREGFKKAKAICNTCAPKAIWGHLHESEFRSQVLRDLKLKASSTAMLSTGADVEKYGIAFECFRDLKVCAIATAGVKTNAMRAGVDKASTFERNGRFERAHVGTINTVIFTNASLARSAMVGAVITATEGKVIALQDLNIRSCYSDSPATGTGTDSVVLVSGKGFKMAYAGGHTVLGEFIAKTVTIAVKEAIEREGRT